MNSNKMISSQSRIIKKSYMVTDNFLDFDTEDIYYTTNDTMDCKVYKNNEVLYEFENKPSILAKKDNYLYIYDYYNIYKLNIDTKQIEKKEKYYIRNLKRIKSYSNELNYFSGGDTTTNYVFNFETEMFDFITLNIYTTFDNVISFNNSLVFTTNTENVKYKDENLENRGAICIYNDVTNQIGDGYGHVRKISFDDKYIYILQESNAGKCEVRKIEIK